MDALAFDLGAGSGKLFRGHFDGEQLALETLHRFDNAAIPLGDGLYWDFTGIWNNLCKGLQIAGQAGEPASLGIDAFCNDFGLIDAAGRLMSPVRCYRDPRTLRCEDAIYRIVPKRELYEETGNQLAPFNTLMQLAAMRLEGDTLALDNAKALLFLPDLMAYFITGERMSEETLCSVSQMYRFDTGTWSGKLLRAYDVPSKLLMPIVKPGTVSGRATRQFCESWGIGGFSFVSVCEHDTASAFLALPGNSDRAIISSGTWALVGCESIAPVINDTGFTCNIANEGSLAGHHRLIRNVMGSWILQQLRAEYASVGEEYSFAQLENMATESEPFQFLIDVDDPAFYSPGGMREKICRSCYAQSGGVPQSPGEYARCISESLALKYRYAVEKLEALTGRCFSVISMLGGGSKDALTCRMTANACGRMLLAGPTDASAIGNILVQLLARGEINSINEGRELVMRSFPPVEYQPEQIAEWNDVYLRYVKHFDLV